MALVGLSFVAWTFGWCAPICAIVLGQAVRIKFMGSNFTRKAMQDADSALKTALPEFLYNITVGPIKNYLCNLSGIKEALENADKDVQLNKEASSAPG